MRAPAVVLFVCSVCLLSANLALAQPSEGERAKPALVARMVVVEHERCFDVQFFLKNDSDRDIEVTYGRGGSGLEIVPVFHLGRSRGLHIFAPTYLSPPRRSRQPDVLPIPAGREILYGTFTLGYPRSRDASEEEIYATIQFEEPQLALKTKPTRLRIPAQESDTAVEVTTIDSHDAPDLPGEWVDSDNGDLSLRLRVKAARLAPSDSIFVIAEIRNNRAYPVTILRPLGYLQLLAYASQIKIWDEQLQIKYIGPIADYDLSKTSFITLEAKEIVTDSLELTVNDFAETGQAGSYAVRYDYAYDGDFKEELANEGVTVIWQGAISSREVRLTKLDGIAPAQRPSQEQLAADLRKLLPLAETLNEKPDDTAAQQAAAALAIRLAPDLPGNRVVAEVLITTRTLKDGMSLAEAEELLGPPNRKSDKSAGWFLDPDSEHVAPYLHARVRKEGLAEWRITNQ